MPNFSKSLKTVKFHGMPIPQSAKLGAKGSAHGVYFFWKGEWMFTVIEGFYIQAASDKDFKIEHYIGDNPVEKLK